MQHRFAHVLYYIMYNLHVTTLIKILSSFIIWEMILLCILYGQQVGYRHSDLVLATGDLRLSLVGGT